MKVAISGASGKTGYRIAEEAIKKKFQTKLLVRNSSILPKSLENKERCNVSLFNPSKLDNALRDCDALIIATGARPSADLTGPCKIDARAVKQQVESCQRVGLKRIILVSSLCSGKLIHPLNLFGFILLFKRIGERALENSQLDWTVIRPGGLNEDEENIKDECVLYSSKNTQEEGSIPRRLVASSCIEALQTKESIGKIIEITSSPNNKRLTMQQSIEEF
ncbi:SDR family oxidoreductase [Prochlorococcus marinus]|nr:SDR family oxidoreductase [Prochlorococcus marinus]